MVVNSSTCHSHMHITKSPTTDRPLTINHRLTNRLYTNPPTTDQLTGLQLNHRTTNSFPKDPPTTNPQMTS